MNRSIAAVTAALLLVGSFHLAIADDEEEKAEKVVRLLEKWLDADSDKDRAKLARALDDLLHEYLEADAGKEELEVYVEKNYDFTTPEFEVYKFETPERGYRKKGLMVKRLRPEDPKAAGQGGFLGVQVENDEGGVRVLSIVKGSAAEKAGLKTGDLIVSINKKKVGDTNSFTSMVRKMKPGAKVTLSVKRGRTTKEIRAVLGKRPAEERFELRLEGDDDDDDREEDEDEPGDDDEEDDEEEDQDEPGDDDEEDDEE